MKPESHTNHRGIAAGIGDAILSFFAKQEAAMTKEVVELKKKQERVVKQAAQRGV